MAASESTHRLSVCSEACICEKDAECPKSLKKVVVKVNGVTVTLNTDTTKDVVVNVDNSAATVEFVL